MTLHLGGTVDEHGERVPDREIAYDPSDLTTHGVVIGMTGSGKTGLGIVFLEEALRSGIPTLVIDPKGDMTNLLLTFPDLAPSDFRPWVDATRTDGSTLDEAAEEAAAAWREGLASWGIDGDDIAALRSGCDMTIYTPGSSAGVPLNVVGDLAAPDLDWDADAETIRDGIQGFVSGLLGLVDIDADPISSREHILVSNLIEHGWRRGADLDLETIIAWIVRPPIRTLGVFDIDTFFPEKDRTAFAMRLNGLLASPSFAAWMQGSPLDIEALLWNDRTPRAAIVYLAHLSDAERQFIVTALFSRLLTWMRTQPGSSELRALVYMDEVFGYVPPVAEPPSKKPILTMLKQARAFGIGLLLSTQNPVDLDYKAMSNAGTWCIGRLQTERDKARVLEGLAAASGAVDIADVDRRISGLAKRVFVLHSTRSERPTVLTSRWAMSYLRGPMTKEEVASLTATDPRADRPVSSTRSSSPSEQTPDAPEGPPAIPDAVEAVWLDAAAPWAASVGFDPEGDHYEPVLLAQLTVHYDEARIDLEHTTVLEVVVEPGAADDRNGPFMVDPDPRDLRASGDELPYRYDAPIGDVGWYRGIERTVLDHVDRTAELTVYRQRELDLVSAPGETREAFASRVRARVSTIIEEAMADRRSDYERRIRDARRAYDDAVRDADDAAEAAEAATGDAILGAGLDLLMGRKPKLGRASSRSAERRLRTAENAIEKARRAYEDLGSDLEDDLRDIAEKWAGAVDDIEEIAVGVERDDLRVDRIRLLWVQR